MGGLDITYAAALAVVFAAVVSLVLAARYVAGGRGSALRDRIRRFTSGAVAPATLAPEPESETSTLLRATLSPLARLATPSSAEELGRLRARLVQSGFRGERALLVYLACKVVGAVALGVLAMWITAHFDLRLTWATITIVAAMIVGFYAPALYLASRLNDRRAQIEHTLPNALDLLVTCVEAGLGLDQALDRVAAEVGLGAPLLAREMRQTALEISAGLPRGDAFRRMADRTGVDEVRALAAIIVQTQMFGTSIARSLRVQADSMRVRRMQRAEERAATAGVKMTVPLIFGIVPALLIVLMAPGVVRIIRYLLPALGGGQ